MVVHVKTKNDILQSINAIGELVKTASVASGRSPEAITTIAISKKHPAELIKQVLDLGQKTFGENRVQEAIEKWPALKDKYLDIELHLVGSLQKNKVARAVEIFNFIHTIDNIKLARAVARVMD